MPKIAFYCAPFNRLLHTPLNQSSSANNLRGFTVRGLGGKFGYLLHMHVVYLPRPSITEHIKHNRIVTINFSVEFPSKAIQWVQPTTDGNPAVSQLVPVIWTNVIVLHRALICTIISIGCIELRCVLSIKISLNSRKFNTQVTQRIIWLNSFGLSPLSAKWMDSLFCNFVQ